jgi:hypothetical protein
LKISRKESQKKWRGPLAAMLTQVRAAGGASAGVRGEHVRSCSNRIHDELVDDFFMRGAKEWRRFYPVPHIFCALHQSVNKAV